MSEQTRCTDRRRQTANAVENAAKITWKIICFEVMQSDAKPLVRKERLELSRREALEPKSSASTNSATFALYFRGRDYSTQKILNQMNSTVEFKQPDLISDFNDGTSA